jgi:CRISPR-associated protein Csx10
MLALQIELVSPLCPGAGTGRAGYVDRDVTFDAAGLPLIAGRSLKGLLRDAYRQLANVLPAGASGIEELFGKPGEELGGALRIGNAHLEDHDRLRAWLEGAYAYYGETIQREDVIASYTEIRRQTAIDRDIGSPRKETLRATRVLRRGLRFQAAVHGNLREADRARLALAAAALRQMGTARTRGLGEVACALFEDGKDLTAEYLRRWAASEPLLHTRTVENEDEDSPSNGASKTPTNPDELSLLRFQVHLEEPALFPALEGDANTVVSAEYVPGSAIRGLLARRYLSRSGADFGSLFLTGEVKFLPALPVFSGRRCLAVPHSIRQDKDEETMLYDFAYQIPERPARRVSGWCRQIPASGGWRDETRRGLKFHHARAKDPRVGRAVGERAAAFGLDLAQAGAVFTYEALESGQTFGGAIIGPRNKLLTVRSLIESGETVWLGRSRSAQYGRAKWRWTEGDPVPATDQVEAQNWEHSNHDEVEPGEEIAVILLSPLLAQNETGHPEPKFPEQELALALGLFLENGLKPKKSFVRTTWMAGYLAHQRLPRQQVPALAPGSVFVFEANGAISSNALQHAQWRSYGMRQEDGFGRLAILPKSSLCELPVLPLRQSEKPERPRFTGDNDPARELAVRIFQRRVAERAAAEALHEASLLSGRATKASNHVLARVAGLVAHTRLSELPTILENFRDKAKGQLEDVRGPRLSLWEILRFQKPEGCNRSWEAVYQHFVRLEWTAASRQGEKADWQRLFGEDDPPRLTPDEAVVRNYLLLLLGSLRRAHKRQSSTGTVRGAA